MAREVPKEIEARCSAWHRFFVIWYALHYVLGVVAIACSLAVAYLAAYVNARWLTATLSFLSATCIAVDYFLFPYKKAEGYVRAWRILSSAIIKFQTDDSVKTSTLSEAIDKGENQIAHRIQ